MNTAILVPTYNAGDKWIDFLNAVKMQTIPVHRKVILDSGSTDNTVTLAQQHGFEVLTINKENFDHGHARQVLANSVPDCDILVYLTQDSILADHNSIENLVALFNDKDVSIAYGRQLPHNGAKTLETHARLFNYPNKSVTKSIADKHRLGIKTASCSNSFASYRHIALNQIGGFPKRSIFGEDVIVGGQLLQKNWKIAYVANATAYHSHNYTVVEEFKRYFDIGVFHSINYWLIEEFGKADGEGIKYIKSEIRYVLKTNVFALPKMVMSFFAKYIGYKLGLMHQRMPLNINRMLSMHKKYWK